jgi:putative transposase
MPNIHRFYIPNATIFITGVTRNRLPYLKSDQNIQLYWETLKHVQEIYPSNLLAFVILPDHFHWLMRMQESGENFSKVLHSFKRNFTLNFKKAHNITTQLSLWQRGYWDHIIRDEFDLRKHFDYIHWNPVKHNLVDCPEDCPHSSYMHWYERGYYNETWGWIDGPEIISGMEFE